ncbi:tripartite motif-containing protein 66-like isoform X2 [Myripristis murdjan]|nr:tripartite motif-containing protein 66-like isoform X2 [Myripristis murdjan]
MWRPDLLEMAELPHRRHGNFPHRRAMLLPWQAKCGVQLALEATPSETSPYVATAAAEPNLPDEQISRTRFKRMEMEPNISFISKNKAAPLTSEKLQTHPALPDKGIAALLKRIRVHPEARRILGNSCIAIVCLERLRTKVSRPPSVPLLPLQPVVSLVRLPCQTHVKLHNADSSLDHGQQNGSNQSEPDIVEIREAASPSKSAGSPDLSQLETTAASWTEPYCPDSSPSTAQEPEQDSGFDCESNPDPPYILLESGSEWDPDVKTDSEPFYLDPDPEQNIVIEVDPDLELPLPESENTSLELHDKSEPGCEEDVVCVGDSGDQSGRCSPTQQECVVSTQQPDSRAGTQDMESEDFCAVCLNGGDLLCCDRCPKVYHLACHIPPLTSFPLGDWVCTLCRSDQEPVEAYDCESMNSSGAVKAPYTLSNQEQRRCEKLTLLLSCHMLSTPFHEPVSPLARNYYQIIKKPMDLSVIRRKLDKSNTLHYFTAEQFVDDVLLMFKNCATFNYPDSEMAQAGRNLEVFFLSKLSEVFPEQTFPTANQDRMDRARMQWLSRKRRENYRKKKCAFKGKKYYL